MTKLDSKKLEKQPLAPAVHALSPNPGFSTNNQPADNTPLSSRVSGVGGDTDGTFIFKIQAVTISETGIPAFVPSSADNMPVYMELAPARRSFHERNLNQVPGAGAGLEIRSRANIIKFNVPGSRPIYQNFGMSEETLEWVGAFIGTDHETELSFNPSNQKREKGFSGWDQSQQMVELFRNSQEVMIQMGWFLESGPSSHELSYSDYFPFFSKNQQTVRYTGFIKEFSRSYATEQRVYYRIVFVVTNRHDINTGGHLAPNVILAPKTLEAVAAGDKVNSLQKQQEEADKQQDALNGGLSKKTYENLSRQLENTENIVRKIDGVSKDDVKEISKSLKVARDATQKIIAAYDKPTFNEKSPFYNYQSWGTEKLRVDDLNDAISNLSSIMENPRLKNIPFEVNESIQALKHYTSMAEQKSPGANADRSPFWVDQYGNKK